MSAMNNARTAWKEMSQMVGLDKKEAAEEVAFEAEAQQAPVESRPIMAPAPLPLVDTAPVQVSAPQKAAATTIAEGTVITGNVVADGDMTVNGTVYGNLQCGGVLQCRGQIQGDISASSVLLVSAKICGGIKAKSAVQIDQDTMVVGNVEAENIALDGKLKGDLLISGMTHINTHAVLLGNITTDRLSIKEGSCFSGALKMAGGKDLAEMFPKENG